MNLTSALQSEKKLVDVGDSNPRPPACKSMCPASRYLESRTYIRRDSPYSVGFGLFWGTLGTICVRMT
jgi:hypothetical protein